MTESRVVLVGFMGAGKSRVGQALATLLARPFTDLDEAVAARGQSTIGELFDLHGEAYFREREAEELELWLGEGQGVLATGGGVVETPQAHRRLVAHRPVVWLDPPFEELRRRLARAPRARRPLVDRLAWDALERLLQARRPLYEACADLSVHRVAESPEAMARDVLRALREAGSI